jgi:hypothetical protein
VHTGDFASLSRGAVEATTTVNIASRVAILSSQNKECQLSVPVKVHDMASVSIGGVAAQAGKDEPEAQ